MGCNSSRRATHWSITYMAFDVDEYARLARWTGDTHYLAVATLLLLTIKNMTGIPERTYDLKGAGVAAGTLGHRPAARIWTASWVVAMGGDRPTQRHIWTSGI